METWLCDGKALAHILLEELRERVSFSRVAPGLAVLAIGEDEASNAYLGATERASRHVGIHVSTHRFGISDPTDSVLRHIERLNSDNGISAIMLQFPAPMGFDPSRMIQAIDPNKDADGFHPVNIRMLSDGRADIFIPPLIKAVMYVLLSEGISLRGKKIAIISKNSIACGVFYRVFSEEGAFAHVVFVDGLDSPAISEADILVSLAGKPGIITGRMIKEGSVIIDIGTTPTQEGMRGDCDLESVQGKAAFVTPTPGGIGPVTVAMLLNRTYWLSQRRKKTR